MDFRHPARSSLGHRSPAVFFVVCTGSMRMSANLSCHVAKNFEDWGHLSDEHAHTDSHGHSHGHSHAHAGMSSSRARIYTLKVLYYWHHGLRGHTQKLCVENKSWVCGDESSSDGPWSVSELSNTHSESDLASTGSESDLVFPKVRMWMCSSCASRVHACLGNFHSGGLYALFWLPVLVLRFGHKMNVVCASYAN